MIVEPFMFDVKNNSVSEPCYDVSATVSHTVCTFDVQ